VKIIEKEKLIHLISMEFINCKYIYYDQLMYIINKYSIDFKTGGNIKWYHVKLILYIILKNIDMDM